VEYPEVTTNMIGPSITPSRTKGMQPIVSSDGLTPSRKECRGIPTLELA